jgi:NADH:ubiquinone oxidoreductase subunit
LAHDVLNQHSNIGKVCSAQVHFDTTHTKHAMQFQMDSWMQLVLENKQRSNINYRPGNSCQFQHNKENHVSDATPWLSMYTENGSNRALLSLFIKSSLSLSK